MTTDPNEPAFPQEYAEYRDHEGVGRSGRVQGLTKREHFAGAAMQGLLSCSITKGNPTQFAHESVRYADALIVALNQEGKQV